MAAVEFVCLVIYGKDEQMGQITLCENICSSSPHLSRFWLCRLKIHMHTPYISAGNRHTLALSSCLILVLSTVLTSTGVGWTATSARQSYRASVHNAHGTMMSGCTDTRTYRYKDEQMGQITLCQNICSSSPHLAWFWLCGLKIHMHIPYISAGNRHTLALSSCFIQCCTKYWAGVLK